MKIVKIITLMLFLIIASSCDNTTADIAKDNQENTIEVVLSEKIELNVDSTRKIEYQINKITGVKHGFYKEFDALSNALLVEKNYKENKLNGVEKIYFPNGQVEVSLTYKDGVHDGEFSYYYNDGKIRQKGAYVAGKIEGMLIGYYPNGAIKEEIMHLGGLTQGVFREYNENGKIAAEGTFTSKGETEELEQGLFKEYDGEGQLIKKMYCKEGQCCTIWTLKDGDVQPINDVCEAIVAEMQKEES